MDRMIVTAQYVASYVVDSGSGYKALRILGNCMEVFVDCYPKTDPKGVLKVVSGEHR